MAQFFTPMSRSHQRQSLALSQWDSTVPTSSAATAPAASASLIPGTLPAQYPAHQSFHWSSANAYAPPPPSTSQSASSTTGLFSSSYEHEQLASSTPSASDHARSLSRSPEYHTNRIGQGVDVIHSSSASLHQYAPGPLPHRQSTLPPRPASSSTQSRSGSRASSSSSSGSRASSASARSSPDRHRSKPPSPSPSSSPSSSSADTPEPLTTPNQQQCNFVMEPMSSSFPSSNSSCPSSSSSAGFSGGGGSGTVTPNLPMEVPLRATQASGEMRRMMTVFRLNPFALIQSSASNASSSAGDGGQHRSGSVCSSSDSSSDGSSEASPTPPFEAKPLEEEPLIFEFQVQLDDPEVLVPEHDRLSPSSNAQGCVELTTPGGVEVVREKVHSGGYEPIVISPLSSPPLPLLDVESTSTASSMSVHEHGEDGGVGAGLHAFPADFDLHGSRGDYDSSSSHGDYGVLGSAYSNWDHQVGGGRATAVSSSLPSRTATSTASASGYPIRKAPHRTDSYHAYNDSGHSHYASSSSASSQLDSASRSTAGYDHGHGQYQNGMRRTESPPYSNGGEQEGQMMYSQQHQATTATSYYASHPSDTSHTSQASQAHRRWSFPASHASHSHHGGQQGQNMMMMQPVVHAHSHEPYLLHHGQMR